MQTSLRLKIKRFICKIIGHKIEEKCTFEGKRYGSCFRCQTMIEGVK